MLLAALMIGSCAPSTPATPATTTPSMTGEITGIVDGDTFETDTPDGSMTIRLVTINAPDIGECYFDEARAQLAGDEGSVATLEVVGPDQFGRTLAHAFVGRRHLNLELVAGGSAIAVTPDEGDVYGAEILAAEENAYEEGLGLWGATACGPSGPAPAVRFDPDRSSTDPRGPDGDDLEAETIGLAYEGVVDVDLSGWVIRDESSRNRYTFPDGVVLHPGERLVITSADPAWSPGGAPVWNNDGDMALLEDDLGTVVARWRY